MTTIMVRVKTDLSATEAKERAKLHLLWLTGRATKSQMLRCLELDRRVAAVHAKSVQP